MNYLAKYEQFKSSLSCLDGLPALLLRLYLAPIFIMAGYSKMGFVDPSITGFSVIFANENIVNWFGNEEWGLGLPLPTLMANLAAWTEFFGGFLLLFGAFTRLISIPLMFTMIVAATSVHAENGWFAITPTNADISPANVPAWVGFDSAEASLENSMEASKRLSRMRDIIEDNANTDWIYETGNIVVLNNGIEFAATYFIMLLALFFIGAGRFTSVDHYALNYARRRFADTSA
ncbi:HvfX family Cu-binding RiPP maturation protein [Thalassotalea agarivorans]|uniref:DoxX protein n=1 Tax=Thalassotalea agarivorans TaxID=349064 RepID=A0A1I0EXQ6_THASX|nr:DoxX family protein [Thalassotalea agarivorans]SET50289.1 DoxX protein [Thalassotalea agarivorans]